MDLPCYARSMRHAKTPKELGFSPYDRRRLAKALKGVSDARLYRRLQAVLLVARGRLVGEVAQIAGVSLRSVYHWVGSYLRDHRADDLQDRPRSGRPPAAATITDARIAEELRKDTRPLGYSATSWTVALLAKHLSRTYHCKISERTLRRRMRALGLRWKRPRYVYAGKEPHRAQKKGPLSAGCGVSLPGP
jgi:transposase